MRLQPKTKPGERYGRLIVISPGLRRGRGPVGRFICRCDCGKELEVLGHELRSGSIKSCGCLRRETLEAGRVSPTATGDRYGRLVVLEESGRRRRARVFRCRCDCGNEVEVVGTNLRSGATRSCGCLARDMRAERPPRTRHGHARKRKSPTYVSWQSMLARCRNPKHSNYHRYGGRGITVCADWASFDHFLADLGERPAGCTLDRIDPDGNYEPGNVRWAPDGVQDRDKGRRVGAPGMCRKGLHDLTAKGARSADGRCAACRRASKLRHARSTAK